MDSAPQVANPGDPSCTYKTEAGEDSRLKGVTDRALA
jgi:hypothetical protein